MFKYDIVSQETCSILQAFTIFEHGTTIFKCGNQFPGSLQYNSAFEELLFTSNIDSRRIMILLLTDLHFIDINFRTIKLQLTILHDQNKLLQKPEAIKYGI